MAKSLDSQGSDSHKCFRCIFKYFRQRKSSVKAKSPVYNIHKQYKTGVVLVPLIGINYIYKDTPPVQAKDLDGPSSVLAESRFGKELQSLPYAFCAQPQLPHIRTFRYPQYRDEHSRLRTFEQNWCHDLDTSRFAAAGFFYTGPGDLVRCFWCGVGFKDWTPADNPWYQHIKLSRDCGFPASALSTEDLHAYQEQIKIEQTQSQQMVLGTHEGISSPHYPKYATADVRISSFSKWPKVTPTAWALAEAGLFYTGVNDSVRCFHCNGCMRNWDDGDDPWLEHARWFPACGFVRQVKGDEYIRLVQLASNDDEEGAAAQAPEIVRGLQTMTLNKPLDKAPQRESENPLYSPAAQAVIDMGFSRAAVSMAIDECNRERRPWNAEILVNILSDKQARGEPLPPESPKPRPKHSCIQMEIANSMEDLIAQNDSLKKQWTCCLCEKNESDILFLPCGHVRVCEMCSSDIQMCMFCETLIKEKIKTFR